jgi:hypothetical protein
MATTIQIKRSPNIAAPSTASILEGELAYSYDKTNNGTDAKLYIEVQDSGGNETIHTIGGKYYTAKVDAATSASTSNALVQRDVNGSFAANNISLAGNITLGGTKITGGGSGLFVDPVRAASSGNVVYYNPATKELTYALAGAAATADKLTTARDIGLAGDLTGNVSFDGSSNVTLTATIAANSVALGTDTTGDYVAGVSSGTGVNVSGSGGEGSTVTVDLAASGVSASTYGGSATTPVITVDSYGRITNAANVTTTVANTNITGNIIASQITSIANTQITGDIVLGTQTSGNYLANVIPGTGLTGSGFGTEGATPTLNLANTAVTAGVYGGTTNIPTITVDAQGRITSASNSAISTSFTAAGDSGSNQTISGGDTLTIAGGTGLTSVGSGTDTITINLDNTAVTPSTYGGAASVGVFTVDQQGRLTAASNVAISIPSSALNTDVALGSQTSGAYVANLVAGTGITLSGLGNEGTTPTITNSGVTQVTGTANQIATSAGTGSITLSLPNDVVIPNNLTVTGDLIISGNAVTMNTATILIEDPLIKLGNANPSDSLDIGFFGEYTSSGAKWAGLFRDASDSGKFKLFNDLTVNPTSNVVDTASYTIASLVANITGGSISGLTANIAVGDGGTGVGTFTTNGVLYGNATGSLKVTSAGSFGQVLQVNASGVPIFAGIDGGTY